MRLPPPAQTPTRWTPIKSQSIDSTISQQSEKKWKRIPELSSTEQDSKSNNGSSGVSGQSLGKKVQPIDVSISQSASSILPQQQHRQQQHQHQQQKQHQPQPQQQRQFVINESYHHPQQHSQPSSTTTQQEQRQPYSSEMRASPSTRQREEIQRTHAHPQQGQRVEDNNLGSFFVSSHDAMKRIIKFDEVGKQPNQVHQMEVKGSESTSSTEDLQRAVQSYRSNHASRDGFQSAVPDFKGEEQYRLPPMHEMMINSHNKARNQARRAPQDPSKVIQEDYETLGFFSDDLRDQETVVPENELPSDLSKYDDDRDTLDARPAHDQVTTNRVDERLHELAIRMHEEQLYKQQQKQKQQRHAPSSTEPMIRASRQGYQRAPPSPLPPPPTSAPPSAFPIHHQQHHNSSDKRLRLLMQYQQTYAPDSVAPKMFAETLERSMPKKSLADDAIMSTASSTQFSITAESPEQQTIPSPRQRSTNMQPHAPQHPHHATQPRMYSLHPQGIPTMPMRNQNMMPAPQRQPMQSMKQHIIPSQQNQRGMLPSSMNTKSQNPAQTFLQTRWMSETPKENQAQANTNGNTNANAGGVTAATAICQPGIVTKMMQSRILKQAACTSAPAINPTMSDEEKDKKGTFGKLWQFLDINDDLNEYDDEVDDADSWDSLGEQKVSRKQKGTSLQEQSMQAVHEAFKDAAADLLFMNVGKKSKVVPRARSSTGDGSGKDRPPEGRKRVQRHDDDNNDDDDDDDDELEEGRPSHTDRRRSATSVEVRRPRGRDHSYHDDESKSPMSEGGVLNEHERRSFGENARANEHPHYKTNHADTDTYFGMDVTRVEKKGKPHSRIFGRGQTHNTSKQNKKKSVHAENQAGYKKGSKSKSSDKDTESPRSENLSSILGTLKKVIPGRSKSGSLKKHKLDLDAIAKNQQGGRHPDQIIHAGPGIGQRVSNLSNDENGKRLANKNCGLLGGNRNKTRLDVATIENYLENHPSGVRHVIPDRLPGTDPTASSSDSETKNVTNVDIRTRDGYNARHGSQSYYDDGQADDYPPQYDDFGGYEDDDLHYGNGSDSPSSFTSSPSASRQAHSSPDRKGYSQEFNDKHNQMQKQKEKSGKSRKSNSKITQKYVAYSRFGKDARKLIKVCERSKPPAVNLRKGELLIKTMVSTISLTDSTLRRGEWKAVSLDPYIIPGVAFVGEIQTGRRNKAFHSFKQGDRVMALVKSGANARYISVPKDRLVKVPVALDPSLVVCLAESYVSAFQAVHIGQRSNTRYKSNSLTGKSFLILGGYSPMGQALIEVSLAAGADFVYATAREQEFDALASIGAVPIGHDPEEWLTLLGRQITTLVAFGAGPYSEDIRAEHLKTLNEDGQIILIDSPGNGARRKSTPHVSKLFCTSGKNKLLSRVHSFNVFDNWDSDLKQAKRDLDHLLELLEDRRLNPIVLDRIPLIQVAAAQSIVENNRVDGHIVCDPWS